MWQVELNLAFKKMWCQSFDLQTHRKIHSREANVLSLSVVSCCRAILVGPLFIATHRLKQGFSGSFPCYKTSLPGQMAPWPLFPDAQTTETGVHTQSQRELALWQKMEANCVHTLARSNYWPSTLDPGSWWRPILRS